MDNYLVLGLNPWSIVDEKTGEIKEGITCIYADNAPINDGSGKVGYFPLKVSLDIKLKDKLKSAPAVYGFDFGMKPDSKGKPSLYVRDIKFVKTVDSLAGVA